MRNDAIHNQRDRRNLTDADIIRYVEILDKRAKHGAETGGRGNQHTKSGKTPGGALPAKPAERSSSKTASTIGVSPRKVERTRTVADFFIDTVMVESGKKLN